MSLGPQSIQYIHTLDVFLIIYVASLMLHKLALQAARSLSFSSGQAKYHSL